MMRVLESRQDEYLDYQIPFTQLKGPKKDGYMQAAKRDCNTSQYMVMWAADRFKRYGRYSERAKLLLGQSIGIVETNTFQLQFCFQHENCGSHRFGRFVGVKVGVSNLF